MSSRPPDDGPPTGKVSGSYDIAQARRAWCATMCSRAIFAAAGWPDASWKGAVRRRQLHDLAVQAATLADRFEAWHRATGPRLGDPARGEDVRAFDALVSDAAALGVTPY